MEHDTDADAGDLSIGDRMDRLEEIAETLEAGNVDLERAKELRAEADTHLSELRTELDIDGEITDLELGDPNTTD
mgnify:CR=1 FL=1